jgi:intein/homing endonuclease
MFKSKKRFSIRASVNNRHQVLSSFTSYGGAQSGSAVVSAPGMGNQTDTMLQGILDESNEKVLLNYYRDIYNYDPVAGAAVDLMSTLPFSDFTLMGASEEELEPHNTAIEMLGMKSILPEASIDYLVLGKFICSIIYKRDAKNFTDLVPHPVENIKLVASPLYGADPLIILNVPQSYRDFIQSKNPHFQMLRDRLNKPMLDALTGRQVMLDSLTTLYIPRKTFTNSLGTSLYRRILPMYLFERILYRGTLTEAGRRQRSTLHITAGSEDSWEPTEEELRNIVSLFQQADLDPMGAIIATRTDIQTNEIRCLAGNTLVTTEKGLLPISKLVEHDTATMEPGTAVDVSINVRGYRGYWAPVKQWLYNGVQPIKHVYLANGLRIDCTDTHKFMTVNIDAELDLVQVSDITPSSYLMVQANAHDIEYGGESNLSPELAYLLGWVLADERSSRINNGAIHIPVKGAQSNYTHLLERFKSAFSGSFIFKTIQARQTVREDRRKRKIPLFTDQVVISAKSQDLELFLDYLGCLSTDKHGNKVIDQTKIPRELLASDVLTKRLFLTGLHQSGLVNTRVQLIDESMPVSIQLHSSQFAQQVALLAISIGYIAECTSNHTVHINKATRDIPLDLLKRILAKHYPGENLNKDFVERVQRALFSLSYGCLDEDSAATMTDLQQHAPVVYNRLVNLAYLGAYFTKVSAIFDGEPEPVYELTMHNSEEPFFIANGLINKNSAGDTWKWNDVVDTTTNYKLKALGISEGFLCLSGNTVITTQHGLITLRDLYPDGESTLDNTHKNTGYPINLQTVGHRETMPNSGDRPVDVCQIWYRGYAPVITVTTANGYEITGTPEHRVLVITPHGWVWKEMRELTPADSLCVAPNYNVFQRDTETEAEINCGLAYFVGVAQRHLLGLLPVAFNERALAEFLERLKEHPELEAVARMYQETGDVVLMVSTLVDLLPSIYGDVKRLTNIPNAILTGNANIRTDYLHGLWSATDNGQYSMALASTEFAKMVQLLYLDLGVFARRKINYLYRPLSEPAALPASLFAEIDLADPKCELSNLVPELYDYIARNLPVPVYKFSQNQWSTGLYWLSVHYPNLYSVVTRSSKYHYFYDPVESVVDNGQSEHVYDLSIDARYEPAFSANGLMVHNSGEVNFSCVVGDTLVMSNHGLLPIRDMAQFGEQDTETRYKMVGGDLRLQGRSNAPEQPPKYWLNNGVAPTLYILTHLGHRLQVTPNHPLLVLRELRLQRVVAAGLHLGDILCQPMRTIQVTHPLPLPKTPALAKWPEYMTPELGFLVGCLLFTYDGQPTLELANYPRWAQTAIRECLTHLFGEDRPNDAVLAGLYELVGATCQANGKPYREVPETILRGDDKAALAYMLGLWAIHGNHTDSLHGEIKWWIPAPAKFSQQLHILLGAHGFMANAWNKTITIPGYDSWKWFRALDGRFQTILRRSAETWAFADLHRDYDIPNERGISAKYIVGCLSEYLPETTPLLRNMVENSQMFYFRTVNTGGYDDVLAELGRCDPIVAYNLRALAAQNLTLVKVVELKNGPEAPVYDLSMNGTLTDVVVNKQPLHDPWFTINGLLGGNTAEIALSVFMEHTRTYRDMLTRRIFYNKLFPLVSAVHGLYRKDQKSVQVREDNVDEHDEQVRKEESRFNRALAGAGNYSPGPNERAITQKMQLDRRMNRVSQLLIPEVQWHKQLRPQADQEYLQVLDTLAEKGVPVTLRMWAAAGGFTLDKLINEIDDDEIAKKTIADIRKEFGGKKGGPEGGEDTDAFGYEESRIKPIGIMNRDYGEASEIKGRTKTGKPKYIFNQRRANRAADEAIVKAMANLAERGAAKDTGHVKKHNPYGNIND